MTLLFMDGFDVGDVAQKWDVGGTTPSTSSTTRFSTGKSISLPDNGSASVLTKSVTASSTMIVGFAFYSAGAGGNASPVFFYGDSGATSHVNLRHTITTLQLYRGDGTLLATSPAGVIATNQWLYIEMSATIADSGGRVIVKANGVTVIDFTGDTKNGGTNTTIDTVVLSHGNAGANNFLFDDLYICNTAGSVNNTFLGDVRVQTLVPTGAGASTQFTPSVGSNWDNVNDLPLVTTTYNSDATSGHRDTYAMGDLISGTGTIFGIQDVLVALKTDAGAASLKAALKSGGTVYYDIAQSLGTSLGESPVIRETDPATSAAWTATNVNALEFGAEVV